MDGAGRLYGTATGGPNTTTSDQCSVTVSGTCGVVFKLARNSAGSWTETVLYAFCSQSNCVDGADPVGGLVIDNAGNLFGTTAYGGIYSGGTVFEIAKTATGYASTPITLANLTYTSGIGPFAGLIADATGNLFGTTFYGGAKGDGVVFELVKTGGNYTFTRLVRACQKITESTFD
jgi:hypothetical protein